MAYSLNKVQLIGNLTRDPELRYTPSGTAVCNFTIATNRQWTDDQGEKQDDAEFHRVVAWNKLAEICGQYLSKGKKVYAEGRLQTRKWTGQDGNDRYTTEVVINEMIMLDPKGVTSGGSDDYDVPDDIPDEFGDIAENDEDEEKDKKEESKKKSKKKTKSKKSKSKKTKKKSKNKKKEDEEEDDDIPF